jgi:UDP-N-acetylglucosamine 4-epimerase
MSGRWNQLQLELAASPRHWLVTGAAGFIGSNLVERLLTLGQRVTGLDNFATGRRSNLEEVRAGVAAEQWARFDFIEGDIRDAGACHRACAGAEIVLHQAALGSVPRSMGDPITSHASNVTGFLNLMVAARDAGVRRFVYASSSGVYGDAPGFPRREDNAGQPLSPYAATKLMDELYAATFARAYGFDSIGLRYFSVFGPRQTPEGAYAAVIPKWITAMLRHEPVIINGDGETSRDFCFVANVAQANLLAGSATEPAAVNQVYNIALGGRTTLNELYRLLRDGLEQRGHRLESLAPERRAFRAGDVKHSQADIEKARRLLHYEPDFSLETGLGRTLDWYLKNFRLETEAAF